MLIPDLNYTRRVSAHLWSGHLGVLGVIAFLDRLGWRHRITKADIERFYSWHCAACLLTPVASCLHTSAGW